MPDIDNSQPLLIVEIAYATSSEQALVTLKMPVGATVEDTIKASGFLTYFPEIDLDSNPVGIFGKITSLDHPIKHQDRIEIYRPLPHDPKEIRRQRAIKK
jgi:uncharacterized protein